MERNFHNETTNVWCLTSSYFSDTDMADENEFRSQMCLAISNKNDYMLIYGARNEEFIDYCVRRYKINPLHLIFTPGLEKSLHEDIYSHHLFRLAQKLSNFKKINFIPRRIDAPFLKWCYVLRLLMPRTKITYFGDSLDWQSVFGNKSILHPRVNSDEKSIWEHFFPHIKVPRGYVCYNKHEVEEAWKKLKTQSVVIKPVKSCGGDGIVFIHSLRELKKYKYKLGSVVNVEENLKMKHKKLEHYATCYDGVKFYGKPVLQLFDKNNLWIGSYTCQTEWNKKLIELTRKITKKLRPRGFGGFDFCVGDNKDIYILDVNTGRFTGSHYPIHFMKKTGLDGHYVCTTVFKKSLVKLTQKLNSLDIKFEILSHTDKRSKIIIYDKTYASTQEAYRKMLDPPKTKSPSRFHRAKSFFAKFLCRK